MKWACDAADTSGLVTDPELIEKLNAKRDAQNTELTQEEPESRQQVTAGKSQEEPDEEAPEKDISRTSETKELAEVDEEKESAEPELPEKGSNSEIIDQLMVSYPKDIVYDYAVSTAPNVLETPATHYNVEII